MKPQTYYRYAARISFAGGLLLTGSMIFFLWNMLPTIFIVGQNFVRHSSQNCGCQHYVSLFDHPFYWTSMIILSLIAAIFLTVMMATLLTEYIKTVRFIRSLNIQSVRQYKGLSLCIFPSERPLCFTAGFFLPRIYCSSHAETILSPQEREAVLQHESFHATHFHPLTGWLSRGMYAPWKKLFGFKYLNHMTEIAHENAADQSVTIVHAKKNLLCAFDKMTSTHTHTVATSFFGSQDTRLRLLLGEPTILHYRRALSLLAVSVMILGIAQIIFAQGPRLLDTMGIHPETDATQCAAEQYTMQPYMMSYEPQHIQSEKSSCPSL